MYVNIFRSRKRPGYDAERYAADAARMVALAQAQPGFLDYKSFAAPDGETVSISTWETTDAAAAWAAHPEHRAVQKRGREEYYESYRVASCVDVTERHFDGTDK